MSHNIRIPSAGSQQNENEIPQELAELGNLIGSMPEAQLSELDVAFRRVVDSVHRRRRILELVQEALSQLRLDIKYMMFDLEATRQERDQLRQQLDDR